MQQSSPYKDSTSMELLHEKAQKEGFSLPKYEQEKPIKTNDAWPDSFWKTYGAINDESFVVPSDISPELDGALPNFD